MDKEKFRELCFQYFLNQIQPEDYAELKDALEAKDKELERIFTEMKKITMLLPLTSETAEPSPSVKRKILGSIRSEPKSENFLEKAAGYLWLNKPKFALAVAAVLTTAVVILLSFVINLDQKIKVQQKTITLLENEAEKNKELLNVLTSREIEVAIMNGLEINPTGYGKIIWDPGRRAAILQISNLPPAAKDKDYQLWVIKENKPISAGVFNVESETNNFYKIENLTEVKKESINAFAVTLEPKGGVVQPTGKMYLVGKPSVQ